jgi:hypothetical protein
LKYLSVSGTCISYDTYRKFLSEWEKRWIFVVNATLRPKVGYNLLISYSNSGMEAVGVVTAVGPGLTGRQVGDLVAYAGDPMGSYTEEQILPANKVVPVPSSIDPIIAASVMLKGMTAQYLLRRCFKVGYIAAFVPQKVVIYIKFSL